MRRSRGARAGLRRSAWVVGVSALALWSLMGPGSPAAVGHGPPSAGSPGTDAGAPVELAPAFQPPAGAVELGPTPSATPMAAAVGLASRDPVGLEQWVTALETPGTPEYRHPLSAAEAAARFGANASSVRTAETYLESYGLTVTANPDGLLLYATGSSGSLADAFHTAFDSYRLASGRVVESHPTAATVPAVAPWTGVYGLGTLTEATPDLEGPVELSAPAAGACASIGGALSPCQIDTAYDVDPLLSNGTDGAGVRIGIVDAYSGVEPQTALASDFSEFTNETGLPDANVSYVYPDPTNVTLNSSSTNPVGWPDEEALDLEWARAAAPGASIVMTFSPNAGPGLYAAIDWLVAHGSVNILSFSWGEPDVGQFNAVDGACSADCNASSDGTYDVLGPVLELAAAEGISTFAASGDCGAADGTSGDSTNFPASDPYVTGVGGTVLSVTSNGTYRSEVAWSGNASGASAGGCVNQGGSGGGYAPFPRPWWQTGLTGGAGDRGVPDVALDAATPVAIVYQGSLYGLGGTSASTPIWAGFTALADEAAGVPLGLLGPALYRIYAGARYHDDFHDIVSGDNGYAAGPGWDPVTGLGTPIVASLVGDLAPAGGLAPGLQVFAYASPRFGSAPLTVTFSLAPAGGTGVYPIEGIYFGDGNATTGISGVVRHTFTQPGVYPAQAYLFDSSGNETVSPPVVVVVGGGGPLSVGLTANISASAVGHSVHFSAVASGGTAPYSYSFWFGDGSSADNLTSSDTNHTYLAAGGVCAEVVVHDNASDPDGGASDRLAIAVGGAATPACGNAASPLVVAPNGTPAMRDAPADFPGLFTVSGGSTGVPGVEGSAEYASSDPYTAACECTIFRSAGNYTVSLEVADPVNGFANATTRVEVAPALTAAFAAAPTAGRAPLTVHFFATASGGIGPNPATTLWSFGDGTTAYGGDLNHTYSTPGEYLAIASLGDDGDGNASEAFLVDVEPALGAVPLGVTASFSPAVNVSAGTTVRFNGTIVGPSAVASTSTLAWELGFGASAYGPEANQTYFVPPGGLGNNTLVGAVAVDADTGLVPLLTVPLRASPFFAVEPGGFVPAVDALTLSSRVDPAVGETPVRLVGTSTASGPGGVSLLWGYDDGSQGPGANVTHILYGVGSYTVTEVATDAFDDRATALAGVAVNGPLEVEGGVTPSSGPGPLAVLCSVAAYGGAGGPYSFAWTENGVPVGNSSTLELTLGSVGRYTLGLTVTDRLGDSTQRTWTVRVTTAPLVSPFEVLAAGGTAGILLAAVAIGLERRAARRAVSPSRRRAGPGGPPGA